MVTRHVSCSLPPMHHPRCWDNNRAAATSLFLREQRSHFNPGTLPVSQNGCVVAPSGAKGEVL